MVSADDLSAFEAKSFDAVTMNYVLMSLGLHVKLNLFESMFVVLKYRAPFTQRPLHLALAVGISCLLKLHLLFH